MSHRLVEMVWSESKPRVLPLLLSLVYALVARLNVDAWREQDQFFVERDPQLAYPAHPSTVSNTHLVLTGCVLPFVLIFGLAAWAHTRVGPDAAVVWWTHQSFALGNALLVAMGTIQRRESLRGAPASKLSPPATTRATLRRWPSSRRWARAALCSRHTSRPRAGRRRRPRGCRAAAAETDEASLSFPSGHAAIAFAGMTRLAAAVVGAGWLAGRRDAPSASLPTEDDEPRGEADAPSARTAERRERCDGEGAFSRRGVRRRWLRAARRAWCLHAPRAFPRRTRARRGVPDRGLQAQARGCRGGRAGGPRGRGGVGGGVSGGAFPSSGVGRKRGGGGSAREDETRLTSPGLVDSRI